MGIQAQEKRDKEVMSIPEGFERLLSDPMVCSGVHQEHTQEHDVACDAASFGVVNLDSRNWSNLSLFDIEKVDVVGSYVDNSEKEHRIGTLSVEPYRFVERKELELWSEKAHDVTTHGQEDEQAIERKD